jgi:glycopeptide antibiotics resistance protein
MILSISYELIQLIFALGATDITDVITNTFGGFLGMCLYIILGRLRKFDRLTIINAIGLAMEAETLVLVTVVMAM